MNRSLPVQVQARILMYYTISASVLVSHIQGVEYTFKIVGTKFQHLMTTDPCEHIERRVIIINK